MSIGYSKEKSAFSPPKKEKEVKPRKPIKARSDKRAAQEREYTKKGKAYLIAHPYCEVKNCKASSEQVHHKKGRTESLLTDDTFFLAVCADCHKKIELEPIWAKENGYSIGRL